MPFFARVLKVGNDLTFSAVPGEAALGLRNHVGIVDFFERVIAALSDRLLVHSFLGSDDAIAQVIVRVDDAEAAIRVIALSKA